VSVKATDCQSMATTIPTPSQKLFYASEQGLVAGIEAALEAGADLNDRASWDWTALHLAAYNGRDDAAKFLIDHNADLLTATSDIGNSPLHLAAVNGHESVVHELLQRRADPNATNNNQESALHKAASQGHVQVIQQLLDAGSDLNIKNV
jgi:ankyrin repeat protein